MSLGHTTPSYPSPRKKWDRVVIKSSILRSQIYLLKLKLLSNLSLCLSLPLPLSLSLSLNVYNNLQIFISQPVEFDWLARIRLAGRRKWLQQLVDFLRS